MASRSSSRRIAAPLAGLAARAVGGEVVEKGISHRLVTTQKLPNVPGELP
jgi:hypothetical protein